MRLGICPKYTKLEWDMYTSKRSMPDVIADYDRKGMETGKILDSHFRQKDNIERILDCNRKEIVSIDLLSIIEKGQERPKVDILVSLGGDNFFQLCTHHYPDATIVGVNSDPLSSHGGILYFNSDYLLKNLDNLLLGKYETEEWCRIKTSINGKMVEDGTCTVSFGVNINDMITRYLLKKDGREEEQKCSGFLAVTGAGSMDGAWYRNAGLYLSSLGRANTKSFSVSEKSIMTLTREPFLPRKYDLLNTQVLEGNSIELVYWSNDLAQLSVDSINRYDVKSGDVIEFGVSENALKIVKSF